MSVELNGVFAGTLRFEGDFVQERELVSAARLLRQGRNELALRFARHCGPPDEGDFELLSIGWR